MSRPPLPNQFEALAHIRDCVTEHGDELGGRIARARFPGVHKATWSRWVTQVRSENVLHDSQPGGGVAVVASIAQEMPIAETELFPAAIDFYGQIGAMMAACDALQDYAWPRDPATGGRKVRNPMMLERATRLRATVLDLAHRRDLERWNIERTREIQGKLVAVIADAAREDERVGRKIVEALRSMDAELKANGRFLGSNR